VIAFLELEDADVHLASVATIEKNGLAKGEELWKYSISNFTRETITKLQRAKIEAEAIHVHHYHRPVLGNGTRELFDDMRNCEDVLGEKKHLNCGLSNNSVHLQQIDFVVTFQVKPDFEACTLQPLAE